MRWTPSRQLHPNRWSGTLTFEPVHQPDPFGPVYQLTSLPLQLPVCLLTFESVYLSRCRRPRSQQPSVVLMWDRLLLVVGSCNDTIQYP